MVGVNLVNIPHIVTPLVGHHGDTMGSHDHHAKHLQIQFDKSHFRFEKVNAASNIWKLIMVDFMCVV